MFKPIEWTITHEQIKDYADHSGDNNPIHLNSKAAQKAGLPDCIAHGMLVMALGSRALKKWGIENLSSYEVRFQALTFPNEALFIKGSWLNEGAGKGSLTVENKAGEVKMKGVFQAKRS